MKANAESPLTTLSKTCCQERPPAPSFVKSMSLPKVSQTRTTLGSVNFNLPDHRADQSSGPRVATATDSHRWTSVDASPTARGASTRRPSASDTRSGAHPWSAAGSAPAGEPRGDMPQDVAAVDRQRDAPGPGLRGQQRRQVAGDGRAPSLRLVEAAEVLNTVGNDPGGNEVLAAAHLEAVPGDLRRACVSRGRHGH